MKFKMRVTSVSDAGVMRPPMSPTSEQSPAMLSVQLVPVDVGPSGFSFQAEKTPENCAKFVVDATFDLAVG